VLAPNLQHLIVAVKQVSVFDTLCDDDVHLKSRNEFSYKNFRDNELFPLDLSYMLIYLHDDFDIIER
jgi:hypothetical protein